jgi:carboxypeptidase Q
MKPTRLCLAILFASLLAALASHADDAKDPLADATRKIIAEITEHGKAYDNLRELTAQGPRLSGSDGAAKGVEWAKRKLESYGLDRVVLQPVMVPHWTRGDVERATATSAAGKPVSLAVAALGNSVGTPREGVSAEVVEVQGLEDVKKLGTAVRGKIVFYNRPMDKTRKNTFRAYGGAVDQRVGGASAAARQGAVAVLVRSVTTLADDNPHTGMLEYADGVDRIPAAALGIQSAERLAALLKSDPKLTVHLTLSAARHPAVPSFNVIGELTGRELPQEYVVVGGHLDSWDLAQGAHDDGAGVVQSIEVVRALKALGLRPRRSVRAVLFMAEEIDTAGGKEYAAQAKAKGEKQVAAIESDGGGGAPTGFGVDADEATVASLQPLAKYLAPLHAASIEKGFSGSDIAGLKVQGTITIGLIPDSTHYFDYHHAATDRIEAVNQKDLQAGAAAVAVMAYLMAERGK